MSVSGHKINHLNSKTLFFVSKFDLTIALLMIIVMLSSCPPASAVVKVNIAPLVKPEAANEGSRYVADTERVQGGMTIFYDDSAPDEEGMMPDSEGEIAATDHSSWAVSTENDVVNIAADSMDYDKTTDVYHAQGKVNIIHGGATLKSDNVELDNKNNVATAQGSASLVMGEDTLHGDKIVYNIKDKTGSVYNAKVFYDRNHFYVKGNKIEKSGDNTYFIEQPYATTCDGENPDWAIAGSEMKVTIEGYGLMKDARFMTRGLPVFYTPYLPFPAKTKRQSGLLLPYLSYSRDKDGMDVEIPYFWAIAPQMDATFYQRYIERRGFKEGVEFRYYLGSHSIGTLYGDFISDSQHITENDDAGRSRDWRDSHRRWSYYLNHQTDFDREFYLRTDLIKVSDKWYFKDFTAHNYYLDNYDPRENDPFKKISFKGDESLRYLESKIRVFKGWSNYNLTGLINATEDFAEDNNDQTLQKYPEIIFTGIKQPFFKSPFFYEFAGTYDYLYRDEGQKGHLIDFSPAVSAAFDLGRYLRIIPQFALKETFWSRDDDETGTEGKSSNRTIYNASLAVNSKLSRVYDVNVRNWEKIRHEIKPEIIYSYIPNVSAKDVPDYYLPGSSPFTMPVASLSGDVLTEENAVAWSLTNSFTARVKDKTGASSYLEFLRLKLFQTYDINEAKRDENLQNAERRPFSDLGIEFTLTPHPFISFTAKNLYSFYDGWRQTNYDLHLKDGRGDIMTVGYRYTLDSTEQINFDLRAVITKNIDGILILRRDEFHSRTIENTVGLVYRKQCWSMGLGYTKTDDDERFMFRVSLAGLGNM